MKKVFYLISAVALLGSLASCDKEKNNGKIDFDDLVLDGFYVYGEATGTPDKVLSINAMAAGSNEVDKTVRAGMYEKYIYLEGGKEFSLIENVAGSKTFYGADLKEVNYGLGTEENPGKNFDNNPNMNILQGQLIIGESAPALKVAESGLYHIVLDNNTNKDLAQGAQIIIQKADWGVRGGCNSWGFTAGEASAKAADGSIVYTWKDLDFSAKGEFKFASCNGWKINLDEDGVVKAEVGLGLTDGKLSNTGGNIVVGDKAGLYKITLTYTPKAGAVADAFSYSVELTQESTLPTECYLIGAGIAGWDLPGNEVAMTPAHSEPGAFWAIRYIEAGKGFKFTQVSTGWGKDFYSLGNDTGFTTADGNCFVAETGLYMIEVGYASNTITVSKAEVYGMGDVFGSWDEGKYPFTASDNLFTVTATNAGNLRMYVKSTFEAASGNWWHREFNIYDGKIVYRADGGDQEAVPVTAGQSVTLDFNAGTGTIK